MIDIKFILALALCLLVNLPHGIAASAPVSGYSTEQVLQLGERMYRKGLLPSGEPMRAYVQEDIPVEGTMFSCESCHLRSGLGTAEGTIITLPTNGGKLFKPLHRGAEVAITPSREQLASPFQSLDIRPAYTDETLREALWAGVDAGGRELNWTMPRYELDPEDMDILVYYLKKLSVEHSPGVDEQTLTFATVITDDVNQVDRQAMLGVLQAYVKDRNAQGRHEARRSKHGPFYKQDRYTAYRRLELRIWEINGPPETWASQLENYYREKPVFALLGGISNQSWEPVHRFSEQMQLPCIFPQTPFPVIDENSWYTLYFSKGYYQEGEAAARFLRPTRGNTAPAVVQVVRNQLASLMLSRGFAETWRKLGHATPRTVTINSKGPMSKADWQKLADQFPEATLLLWLPLEDLHGIDSPLPLDNTLPKLIFSSSLLQEQFHLIPQNLREISLITHPHRLPKDMQPRMQFVSRWLQVHELPITNPELQSRSYFLNWMMTGSLRMMGNDFYRDYFLDIIDMMNDETYAIVNYPRVSFGPAQRYASKGCYMVQVGPGEQPKLIARSPWVIH